MGPYLSSHTMFEIVKLKKEKVKEWISLYYWPRKVICGTMKVLEILASKGLCYGIVVDVSYWENPPSP